MTRALFIVDDSDRTAAHEEVLREFVELAGGVDALILVCGLATDDAPAVEADYIDRFTGFGARATHLHTDQPDQLEKATAVWFIDGDETTMHDLVPDNLRTELRRRNDEGLLIGGTGTTVTSASGIDVEHDDH